ncbi:hypothetical protein F2Q70_00043654 [Brassica cretica]|uniref:Uncharacterized protein n=1 Tax=Brassica cretica TaxID=69181 RepID=A0A8S9KNS7_BRACR|nr:hypothetical protein F2Q70_00043654 [Brassica cretica]
MGYKRSGLNPKTLKRAQGPISKDSKPSAQGLSEKQNSAASIASRNLTSSSTTTGESPPTHRATPEHLGSSPSLPRPPNLPGTSNLGENQS